MHRSHNMGKNKLDVAVLMGGISEERDVSLKSGKAVAEALKKRGHRVQEVDIKTRNIEAVRDAGPDVAFIALHGTFGEDGQIQALLEDAGINYTGSGVAASRTGMDKKASKRAYLKYAVPTPSYTVINDRMSYTQIACQADSLGFPLVCKPPYGGSSIGVKVVADAAELGDVIKKWRRSPVVVFGRQAHENGGVMEEMMLEKYIHGRELTVGILDGRPLPVIEIKSPGLIFDYSAKYEDPHTEYVLPVSMIESVYRKVCDAAVRAYNSTGCRHFGRVDMIYGYDGRVYVLEINTVPGLTSRSLLPMAAAHQGIEFSELCEHLCLLAAMPRETEISDDAAEMRKKIA